MEGCITVPAVGRMFTLGMLVDMRKDIPVAGLTFWDREAIIASTDSRPQRVSNTSIHTVRNLRDRAELMSLDASLKLSFIGGLFTASGSCKYVNENSTSSDTCSVSILFHASTKFEQLTMSTLAPHRIMHPYLHDRDIATHVVTGILYGANVIMTFEKDIGKDESRREIEGNLRILMTNVLPGIEVNGEGRLEMNEDDRREFEALRFKCHGDIPLETIPTTFAEAIQLMKHLPQLIGDGVPLFVTMLPMHMLDNAAMRLVRQISDFAVHAAEERMLTIDSCLARCRAILRSHAATVYPRLGMYVSAFVRAVEFHQLCYRRRLAALLPQIRGGNAAEEALLILLAEYTASPFNHEQLKSWAKNLHVIVKQLDAVMSELIKRWPSLQYKTPAEIQRDLIFLPVNHDMLTVEVCFPIMDEYVASLHNTAFNSNIVSRLQPPALQDLTDSLIDMSDTIQTVFQNIADHNMPVNTFRIYISEDTSDGPLNCQVYCHMNRLGNRTKVVASAPRNVRVENIQETTARIVWEAPPAGTDSSHKLNVVMSATMGMRNICVLQPPAISYDMINLFPNSQYEINLTTVYKLRLSNGENGVTTLIAGSKNIVAFRTAGEVDAGGDTFHIFAITLCGKRLRINVNPYDSLMVVACRVQDAIGISPDQMSIRFNNEKLNYDHTLHQYGVRSGDSLIILFRLRGGLGDTWWTSLTNLHTNMTISREDYRLSHALSVRSTPRLRITLDRSTSREYLTAPDVLLRATGNFFNLTAGTSTIPIACSQTYDAAVDAFTITPLHPLTDGGAYYLQPTDVVCKNVGAGITLKVHA